MDGRGVKLRARISLRRLGRLLFAAIIQLRELGVELVDGGAGFGRNFGQGLRRFRRRRELTSVAGDALLQPQLLALELGNLERAAARTPLQTLDGLSEHSVLLAKLFDVVFDTHSLSVSLVAYGTLKEGTRYSSGQDYVRPPWLSTKLVQCCRAAERPLRRLRRETAAGG